MGRQGEAGAQLLERFQCFEALDGIGGHRLSRRRDQIGVCTMMRAANAASQLMDLREPESIGAVDDDGIGGRHVDAALDDRRTYQYVESTVIEVQHELFELAL